MKPCKIVLFDLDGTILNTLQDLTDSLNSALRLHGYPKQSSETVRLSLGNGAYRLIEKCMPQGSASEDITSVMECHNSYYAAHCCEKTAPYPGIPELLRSLREGGILTAVVSNKPDNATQPICRHYFAGQLDYVTGQTESVARKPAPDAVLNVLSRCGLTPEEAVYVGDTEVDHLTALNAGMPCVLVSWGFRDREEILRLGDPVCDSVRELSDKLFAMCRLLK